jgi:hypothetical protein
MARAGHADFTATGPISKKFLRRFLKSGTFFLFGTTFA